MSRLTPDLPTCSIRMLADDSAYCDTHDKLGVYICPTFANELWERFTEQQKQNAALLAACEAALKVIHEPWLIEKIEGAITAAREVKP